MSIGLRKGMLRIGIYVLCKEGREKKVARKREAGFYREARWLASGKNVVGCRLPRHKGSLVFGGMGWWDEIEFCCTECHALKTALRT